MKKKMTAKDMGIPSDFRMSQKNEEKVIVAAIRAKYGHAVTNAIDMEVTFHNCMREYLYPFEKRRQYEEIAKVFGGSKGNLYHIQALSLQFTPAHTERLLPGSKTIKGVQEIRMVSSSLSPYYNPGMRGLLPYKKYASDKSLREMGAMYDIIMKDVPTVGELSDSEIAEALPNNYARRILRFYHDCKELHVQIANAEEKLKRIIATYKSWIKLCNDADVFIPWVKEAAYWNDNFEECNDIPQHDDFAELNKLL